MYACDVARGHKRGTRRARRDRRAEGVRGTEFCGIVAERNFLGTTPKHRGITCA